MLLLHNLSQAINIFSTKQFKEFLLLYNVNEMDSMIKLSYL